MWKVFPIVKFLINILIYIIYTFLFIILGNFAYWAYLTYVLWVSVPLSEDIIHIKLAIFIAVLVLILTVIFRKFFYLSIFKRKK